MESSKVESIRLIISRLQNLIGDPHPGLLTWNQALILGTESLYEEVFGRERELRNGDKVLITISEPEYHQLSQKVGQIVHIEKERYPYYVKLLKDGKPEGTGISCKREELSLLK